jgi:hypothetical protein
MNNAKSVGEYIAQRPDTDETIFDLAPAELKNSIKQAREAAYQNTLAEAETFISKQEIDMAEHTYDAATLESIRNKTDLPSDEIVRRAKAQEKFAIEEHVKANSNAYAAAVRLGNSISDEQARNKWIDGICVQVEKDKAKLAKLAPELAAITERLAIAVAYTHFLGSYPFADSLHVNNINGAMQALNEAINVKPWTRPTPAAEATFQSN